MRDEASVVLAASYVLSRVSDRMIQRRAYRAASSQMLTGAFAGVAEHVDLDEVPMLLRGEPFLLWRPVDQHGTGLRRAARDRPGPARCVALQSHVQVRRHDTEDDVNEHARQVARFCEPRKKPCHAVEINKVYG